MSDVVSSEPLQSDLVKPTYGQLARVFIRLSLTAFGGPAAHIAIAEDELVRRQKWITRQHYLDLVSAANLIPGPNSTETMIHVGYTQRGFLGAILTGACFIIPAAIISLILAILYVSGGAIPQVQSALWGIEPVIVAIILVASLRLARTTLVGHIDLAVLMAASLILLNQGLLPEVVVIIGMGLLYAIYKLRRSPNLPAVSAALLLFAPVVQQAAEVVRASALDLFWYFLRIGSILFGSGYVLISYIESDLVSSFGWLSAQQLLDAVAIGQFTPGPVLTTSTVVGYIVNGLPGALAATMGVFLPSFVFVILSAPLIPKMRQNRFLSFFLDGANAATVAAIAVAALKLLWEALLPLGTEPSIVFTLGETVSISPVALVLLVGSAVWMYRSKINATWLVLIGAGVGLIYGMIVA
jgi:chromate transporter